MRLFRKSVISLSVLIGTSTVVADPSPVQQIQGLSNFYDAGRVSQQFQQPIVRAPKVAPKAQLEPLKPTISNNADKIHFKLTKIIIRGNTIFPRKVFSKIFHNSINKNITLADLQMMVHSVTAMYREAGYILTRAILPPQTIQKGVVHVQIVEGYISNVTVKGDVGRLGPLLQGYGEQIKLSRPLQIHVLERYALLANDLPGLSIQTVINPSKTVPAGADLTLVVATRRRVSGFVSFDNYGTRYIGPNETTVGASLYSIFAPGDSNNLHLSWTSRPTELHFIEFTHAQPIGGRGLHWQIGSDYTTTRPDFILKPLSIIGRNLLVFTDLSYPILRGRSTNFTVHSTFNYQNVTATILAQPFYEDRIRSLVLGGTFDSIDRFHGLSTLSTDVTHGFPILGAKDHENQSRPDGQASYTRINASVGRLQGLTSRFSLYAQVRGQYSFQALLATEQYGVGGPDIGRGYDPSEIVGDRGVSGKVELRMDLNPGWKLLATTQLYGFYDAGVIWNIDSVNLPDKQALTSAGVGARFSFFPQLSGNFFVGKPLTRKVATMTALQHNPFQPRVFFQIALSE